MPEQRLPMLVCNDCGKPSDGPMNDPRVCSCPNLANGERVIEVVPAARIDNAIAELQKRAERAHEPGEHSAYREAIALLREGDDG